MSRRSHGQAGELALSEPDARAHFIPFVHRLAASPAFQELFREGMGLVDEAAAYLDGPGRAESRALPQAAALAYSTESLRLTTRLMQIASWLLLQRAVNEGDLTPGQARSERRRVRLSRESMACPPEVARQWPMAFRALSVRSIRLHERILHLDASLAFVRSPEPPPGASAVARQQQRLAAAFAAR